MNLTVKKRIMFGVFVLYFVRKLKEPFVSEPLIFLTLTALLSYFVSIPNILTNMRADGNFLRYFIMAFLNTNFVVQAILIAVCVITMFFAYNLYNFTGKLASQLRYRVA